ncbi:MAG TPA: DNA-3-methyladenine glycosylase, partial [Polyangiaceae bacterium]|nr:DNA-3-methyladenine glycosylase [Polyangiaceae bacterium]
LHVAVGQLGNLLSGSVLNRAVKPVNRSRKVLLGVGDAAAPSVRAPPGPVRHLRRAELPAGTATLARYLVGKILVHDDPSGRVAGRIVETEAYVVGDAAAHAFRGQTPRNRSLFLERGHAYVYFVYGCWYALNVSGEKAGIGAGVLIRALEPTEGIELMERRRGTTRLLDLARGPGRLAMAMGVDRSLDGVDLCGAAALWLGADRSPPPRLGQSVRIGITREVHRKLRFFERDNAFVSGARSLR